MQQALSKGFLSFIIMLSFSISASGQVMTETSFTTMPPTGWLTLNAGSGNNWSLGTTGFPCSSANYARYVYHSTNTANAWLFTKAVLMTAGYTYRIEFQQRVRDGVYPEKLKVTVGTAQTVASQTTTLYDNNNLTNTSCTNRVSSNYTAPSTGTYYFSFHCYSAADMYELTVDDVRVYETAPPCTAPTTQATGYTASNLANTTLTVGWTRGNGNNVMVIAKSGSAPTDPVSGTTYTANANYGSGTAVGGGFCVYNGTGTSVNLTGLTANTTYYFAVYEYMNTGTCYLLTELTGNTKTANNGNNINHPSGGGSAVYYQCSGNYYDMGGAGADYSASQAASTVTFYPATSGSKMQITFSSFATESATCSQDYDWLRIFNGNSTGATALHPTTCIPGFYTTGQPMTGLPRTFTSTAADGSLTFQFKSDGTPNGAGWVATIACYSPVPNCANINTPANAATNLCPTSTTLNWTAPGLGSAPTGYRVYFGTDAGATNIQNGLDVGNVLTWNPGTLSNNTLYYWKIVPYNGVGNATGCSVWSFTTGTGGAVGAAGAITGTASVCRGQNGVAYSIAALPANASSSVWSYTGTGGTCASGCTTLAITENFSAAATSGNITVYGTNACGNGTSASYAVTVNAVPAQPGTISGNTGPCQSTSQAYSVTNVAGVTYTWAFPSGWVQTAGGTTNSVTVTVGSGSGNITVTPSISICTGTAQTLAVAPITVPAQPGTISGITAPCSGSSQAYSVTNVSGVTYTWTFPAAGTPLWSQTAGGTTNSITASVGSASGNIGVTPSNVCGNGTARSLAVTPGAGPTVVVSPNTASACGGVGVSLTASGATTYSWSPATGLSATTGATVTANPSAATTYTVTETGSGCNNTATVQVKVGPSVSITSAAVLPTAVCPGTTVSLTSGASQAASTIFTENFDGTDTWTKAGNFAIGAPVSGNTVTTTHSGTKIMGTVLNGSYALNATEAVNYAISATINCTGYTSVTLTYWSFSKWENDCSYDWGKVYISNNNGSTWTQVEQLCNDESGWTLHTINISAYADNQSQVKIRFTMKSDGGVNDSGWNIDDITVTGSATPTFSYSWGSSPAGFLSSSQNTTANPAVATTYSLTATQTTSGCTASASTAQVTMNPVPAQPVISGLNSVCAGTSGVVYSIAAITYATGYTWAVPSGATITASASPATSITVTLGSVSGNVTCYATDACGRNSTTATRAVTVLAAPGAPTGTGATVCGTGSVALSASGGTSYNWYGASSGGSSLGTASTYNTPVISIPTTYYVAANNGTCDGPRTAVTAGVFNGGLDAYTVSRTTGITYTDISTGTTVASWKNGSSLDDNLSNAITLPFDFPYDGGIQKSVLISTNGLITFNTATKADGADIAACGTPEPYAWQNDNFTVSGKLGSLQAIAPFYNDLYCNSSLNASIRYTTTGTTPNRVFMVQWKNMSNDEWCSESACTEYDGNLNFQVWLYETSGNIEFYYGSPQTQTSFSCSSSECDLSDVDNDYTVGLNSSTLSASPTASQLLTQQTANTATFSNTAQNGLTTLPATNSKITFVRTAPAAATQIPSSICPIIDNYPANAATNQCLNQILSWSPGDGYPTSYDVYFGTTNPPSYVTNTTHTFYNPGNLSKNTTYYWKIVPKNAFGNATNVQTYSFSTTNGDVQPTEILCSIGTLVSHVANGTNSEGQTVYTNTYEICDNQINGTLSAQNYQLADGSQLDWTNPVYFFGWPVVQCTDAIPTNFWGDCSGGTQTPILTIGGWFTAMFNGGYLIYDVFTRGCNANGSCTRIIIHLNNQNEAPTGITASQNPVCQGSSTTLTKSGGTLSPGAQYVWYARGCGSGTALGTGTSITVTPTTTTTYYVRAEGGSYCPTTTSCKSITITVQSALGSNSITSAPQTICAGATPTTLSGSAPSGGSGTYTYSWESSITSASSGFSAIAGSNTINYSPGALSQTTWFRRTITSGACTTANPSTAVEITVNPVPTNYNITPSSGTYCAGAGNGATIGLSNSQAGVSYQLFRGGTTLVSTLAGTGAAISFGLQTTAGTYTIVATHGTGSCTADMSGTVVINSLPTNITVSSPDAGPYCAGTPVNIQVSVSQSSTIQYQLKHDGVNVGSAVPGNSGTLSLGSHLTAGTYTVVATNTGTGCTRTLTTSVIINTVPAIYNTAGGGSYCSGTGVSVTLSNSQSGVNYQLIRDASTNVGAPVAGTGSGLTWTNLTVAGTYTITATNAAGCPVAMNSNAVISTAPNVTPSVSMAANPGTTFCSGTNVTFTASPTNGGSSPAYVWKLNGNVVTGNGNEYSNDALQDGDQVTVEMTSNEPCASPATVSNSVSVTIQQITAAAVNDALPAYVSPIGSDDFLWTGTSSINWNNADNWLRYSGSAFVTTTTVPAPTQNAFILPNVILGSCLGTNSPTVYNGDVMTAKNVYIGAATSPTAYAVVTVEGVLEVYGNWINDGIILNPVSGTRTVAFTGAASQNIYTGGAGNNPNKRFYNVSVNKTAGSAILQNAVFVLNNFTTTQGTFNNSGSHQFSIQGSWVNNGGIYTPGTGTVYFSGTADQDIKSLWSLGNSNSFYNLNIIKTGVANRVYFNDNANVLNMVTVEEGILETPSGVTVKTKKSEVQSGGKLQLNSNAKFKVNE